LVIVGVLNNPGEQKELKEKVQNQLEESLVSRNVENNRKIKRLNTD